ncbi:MAG: ParB/RepB/Spo0J family partition protein [Candidatus Moraniibacteriota bacterium]
MPREGGLGRGLSSLIPQKNSNDENESFYSDFNDSKKNKSGAADSTDNAKRAADENSDSNTKDLPTKKTSIEGGENVLQIETGKIFPNPYQPRSNFDQEKIGELADSIAKHGILQPLVVTEVDDGNYELVAGERRLQAAKKAQVEKVPSIVRKLDDKGKMELALIENIQRHNLNALEEAEAYKKLQEKFSYTQKEIAEQVGKSRSVIANCLRLLDLPKDIKQALIADKISEGHARTLAGIENPTKRESVFQQVLSKNLTVRDTEKLAGEVEVSSHKRKITPTNPDIKKQEDELEESLGTKVKIKKRGKRGRFMIDFYSEEEFDNLFNKLTS